MTPLRKVGGESFFILIYVKVTLFMLTFIPPQKDRE